MKWFFCCVHTRVLTWVCAVGDDVAVHSSDGRLPEQQSFTIGDVDGIQTTWFIQSCDTQTHTFTQS